MEQGSLLVPNGTLFIQLAIFIASYFVLRFFLFRPYLTLLRLREERTVGLQDSAEQARLQAEELKKNYEGTQRQERRKVLNWLESEQKKISDDARSKVDKARSESSSEVQKQQQKLQAQISVMREDLEKVAPSYAQLLVDRVMSGSLAKSSGAKHGRGVRNETSVSE